MGKYQTFPVKESKKEVYRRFFEQNGWDYQEEGEVFILSFLSYQDAEKIREFERENN